jgi:hypothetical protein
MFLYRQVLYTCSTRATYVSVLTDPRDYQAVNIRNAASSRQLQTKPSYPIF